MNFDFLWISILFLIIFSCDMNSVLGGKTTLCTAKTQIKISSISRINPSLEQHYVKMEDDHHVCVWSKGDPTTSKYCVVLLHGRTWSTIPVYDLRYSCFGDTCMIDDENDIVDSTPIPVTNMNDDNDDEKFRNLSTFDLLAERDVAVFGIDFRGFGGTSKDKSGVVTPNRAVKDVRLILLWLQKQYNIDKPALLGWSQGGLVAHLFAQKFPNLISDVILYASIYDPNLVYQRNSFFTEKEQEDKTETKNTAKAALEDFTLPGSIEDEAGFAFAASALEADPIKATWDSLHEFNAIVPHLLKKPTLIIHGDRDPYLPPNSQDTLFTRLGSQDKAHVILENADHCAHLIASRFAFVHYVHSFLSRPKPSSNVINEPEFYI